MTTNDNELQEESAAPKATVGDLWLRRAVRLARRELPGEHRLRFVAAVYSRHGAALARRALVEQVEERLPGAAPPAGAMPWLGQPPAPAQPMAPAQPVAVPQRPLGEPQPVARAQWQMPPALDLEARQGSVSTSPQSRETGESLPLSQEGMAENRAALPGSVARSPSLPLAPSVHNYLARTLDIRIPAVRIYANQAADQVARRQQADAVTYGRNILFRSGKYDPATRQGLALLGHEVTHVARGEASHAAWQSEKVWQHEEARQHEEAAALQNEQQVLNGFAALPATPLVTPPVLGPPSPPPASSPMPRAAPTPQAAATGRSLNEAGGREAMPAALTGGQLQQIKEAVYRDLMDRIRTEFERGG